MADIMSAEKRSRLMSRIRAKDTEPEMIVRRLTFGMGYRYRLHVRTLPGKPDLVFPGRRKVILVHGCFWHRHTCKLGQPTPKTNAAFWQEKLTGNVRRDKANLSRLKALGWKVLVVWECQTSRPKWLSGRIRRFLEQEG